MERRLFYGTGLIAKILSVSPHTVQQLIDDKHMESWKTDCGRRMVHWQELVKFLKEHGIWDTYPRVSRYLMGLEEA